jgi:hypothetical protein|tara:strand:+ start:165905 stop:166675 length:771 start_codon:yes stop_codon:yes gene_type:complete
MNVGDLEDAFFSFIDWCTAESDDTRVTFSEESPVSVSIKAEIIKEHLIGDWQNIQAKLTNLKSEIGTYKATLLKYVVGVDDKHMLDTICETTSLALSCLQVDHNPGFEEGFEHVDFEARIATCANNLQCVDELHVEGAGGADNEENRRLYQCAYYLIHTIRDLLDVMTRLLGYQSNKNNLADRFIHRPFFFQVPYSPQEVIDIRQARDDLKNVIEQVNQKQDALNRALHKQISIDECSNESVYSDDSFARATPHTP